MTAEIAIMNRQGIALAADSAVTIGQERVWQHANKLFALSPKNDVGIMIYGGGHFIGHPWETVIKCYRKTIGNKKFGTIEECSNHFVEFLKSKEISDATQEANSLLYVCVNQIEIIKKQLRYCSHEIDAQRLIQRMWTAARKEAVFLA